MSSQPNSMDQSAEPVSGGNLVRHRYGGGDTLYGCSSNVVIERIANSKPLILHHSVQTKHDFYLEMKVSAFLNFFLAAAISLIIMAGLLALTRSDALRDLGKILVPAIAIGAAIKSVHRTITINPNYGWEAKKWLDFNSRQYFATFEQFGKQPGIETIARSFDELILICIDNGYWEGASTTDISLVERGEFDRAKRKKREPKYLCHLYMGTALQDAINVGKHFQKTLKVPFWNDVLSVNHEFD